MLKMETYHWFKTAYVELNSGKFLNIMCKISNYK